MQIKVLVVDDSALMRRIVTDMLIDNSSISVIGTARDGKDALAKVKLLKPDVVTLDIEMPKMNGLEALKSIMDNNPLPVIMLSSLTNKGSHATMEALSLGAVDFVQKPGKLGKDMLGVKNELQEKVLAVAKAKITTAKPVIHKAFPLTEAEKAPTIVTSKPVSRPQNLQSGLPRTVIAIGSSTGGPRALETLLTAINGNIRAALAITQHMPPKFTEALANRLNKYCSIDIAEAKENDFLEEGLALIAPGGYHMTFNTQGQVRLTLDPPVEHVRPSATVMMDSLVKNYRGKLIGVILTGMGKDGSEGMASIKRAGGVTLIQDMATSVIYSMPRAVKNQGNADKEAPIGEIAGLLEKLVN